MLSVKAQLCAPAPFGCLGLPRMTVLVSFQPSASAVPRMSSTAWAWLPGGIAPTQTVFLLLTTQLAGKGQP